MGSCTVARFSYSPLHNQRGERERKSLKRSKNTQKDMDRIRADKREGKKGGEREREVNLVSFSELKPCKEQGQNCTPAAVMKIFFYNFNYSSQSC